MRMIGGVHEGKSVESFSTTSHSSPPLTGILLYGVSLLMTTPDLTNLRKKKS